VHGGADRVFGKRSFDRRRLLDEARDRMIGADDAFGGEFLQDLEAAAAGVDFVDTFAVGRWGVDNQVLQMPSAQMLASRAASSAAVAGVLRTLAWERTS
jgi:hypothetical protein